MSTTERPVWRVPIAKEFTAMKLAWHRRVTLTLTLSVGAKALAGLWMQEYLKPEKGCAFAAQETYAERLGVHPRNVRRWIKELRDSGDILAVPQRGREHKPDEIWPVYEVKGATKNRPHMAGSSALEPATNGQFKAPETCLNRPKSAHEPAKIDVLNRPPVADR